MRKTITTVAAIAVGILGFSAAPAHAATGCKFNLSINHSTGKATLYNTPYNVKGNKFGVLYSDGDGGVYPIYWPSRGTVTTDASGKVFSLTQPGGWGAQIFYGTRNGKNCTGSGAQITQAG